MNNDHDTSTLHSVDVNPALADRLERMAAVAGIARQKGITPESMLQMLAAGVSSGEKAHPQKTRQDPQPHQEPVSRDPAANHQRHVVQDPRRGVHQKHGASPNNTKLVPRTELVPRRQPTEADMGIRPLGARRVRLERTPEEIGQALDILGTELAARLRDLAPDLCLGITYANGEELMPGSWSICLHSPDREHVVAGLTINEDYLGVGLTRVMADAEVWIEEEHVRRGWTD